MTEKFPEKRSMAEEALRESYREKIRERLLWLKPTDPAGFRAMVATIAEDNRYAFTEENDFLDHMIDNSDLADRVAEMFEVDTPNLMSPEFISKEDFLAQKSEEGED